MNVRWIALADPDLTPSTKVVYCVLVELALDMSVKRLAQTDEDDRMAPCGKVAITQRRLAQLSGLGMKTIASSCRELVSKKLIKISSQLKWKFCGGPQQRVYEIVWVDEQSIFN